jgi:hypothetical protein
MRSSTALPLAWATLRILIVLNWFYGACVAALLAYTFVNEPWTMKALGVTGYPDAERVMNWMRVIAALGLAAVPINFAILSRLVEIVETVRRGDPFIAANAYRLNAIAWFLLLIQLISTAIGIIAGAISTPEHPFKIGAGFSTSGWLAVLLLFVLARVFAEGAVMREDLEGTI